MFNTKKAKKMHILLLALSLTKVQKCVEIRIPRTVFNKIYIVKAHIKKKNTAQRKQGKNSEKLLTPGSLEPAMNGGMIMTHMLGRM